MKIELIDYGLTALPVRQHYNDTGLDVYVKCENPEFMKEILFAPHETKKLDLGFGLKIPDGYAGYLEVRSSMAMRGLHVASPPIDSGFRGSIHIMVTNLTPFAQNYPMDRAIGQLVIKPIIYAEIMLPHEVPAERGINGYGSTNK